MFKQPRFIYYIPSGPRNLYRIETLVPGCLIYGRYTGKRGRLEHLPGDGHVEIEIIAPIHGAWLVEYWLSHFGVASNASPGRSDHRHMGHCPERCPGGRGSQTYRGEPRDTVSCSRPRHDIPTGQRTLGEYKALGAQSLGLWVW
jgi:hypothetical protein